MVSRVVHKASGAQAWSKTSARYSTSTLQGVAWTCLSGARVTQKTNKHTVTATEISREDSSQKSAEKSKKKRENREKFYLLPK